MAFGKNVATAAQRIQDRLAQQGLAVDGPDPSQDGQSPSPPAAPSRPAAPGPAPSGASASVSVGGPAPARAAFGRPQGPRSTGPAAPTTQAPPGQATRPARPASTAAAPRATPSPSAAPAGGPSPAPARGPAPPSAPVPDGMDGLFGGYVRQVVEHSRRPDGLPLRLERLIDEVCDFLSYDQEKREDAKRRAMADPQAWEKKLADFHINTIRPHRAKTAHTLEEARARHPGKIVFMEVVGGTATLQVVDPGSDQASDQAILSGATVETVSASRTPFGPPAEVFGRADVHQEISAEALSDAFQEPEAPARPPRP